MPGDKFPEKPNWQLAHHHSKEPSGSHIAQGGCFLKKKRPLELL